METLQELAEDLDDQEKYVRGCLQKLKADDKPHVSEGVKTGIAELAASIRQRYSENQIANVFHVMTAATAPVPQ